MRVRMIFAVAVIALGGLFVVSKTISQESSGMSQEEMMAAWMKYAQPGPQHKNLEPLIGSWDAATRWWMSPGSEAQTSTATSECRWILGGRFMQEDVSGMMDDQQFHGIGITGYDNYAGEYVSIWMDEMSTMIMISRGKADATGKIITFEGTYDDPVTGQKAKKMKSVVKIHSNDKHVYENYDFGPDGKEFLSFEVTCTRQK